MLLSIVLSLSAAAATPPIPFFAMEGSAIRLETDCLPESVKAKLRAKDADWMTETIAHFDKKETPLSETKYVEMFDPKEVVKACSLENLRVFFDGKLHDVSYPFNLKHVVSERSDCGYKVPYTEIQIRDRHLSGGFLIGPDFTLLTGKDRLAAETAFKRAVAKSDAYGLPLAYLKGKADEARGRAIPRVRLIRK